MLESIVLTLGRLLIFAGLTGLRSSIPLNAFGRPLAVIMVGAGNIIVLITFVVLADVM